MVTLDDIDLALETALIKNLENGNHVIDISILKRELVMKARTDLKMPKQRMMVTVIDIKSDGEYSKKEVMAEDGMWKRLPPNGSTVVITYKEL